MFAYSLTSPNPKPQTLCPTSQTLQFQTPQPLKPSTPLAPSQETTKTLSSFSPSTPQPVPLNPRPQALRSNVLFASRVLPLQVFHLIWNSYLHMCETSPADVCGGVHGDALFHESRRRLVRCPLSRLLRQLPAWKQQGQPTAGIPAQRPVQTRTTRHEPGNILVSRIFGGFPADENGPDGIAVV